MIGAGLTCADQSLFTGLAFGRPCSNQRVTGLSFLSSSYVRAMVSV